MRKCLPKLLLPIIGMLIGFNAHAYDFVVDGIYYNKNSDGVSVSVTYKSASDRGYSGDVVIPETVTYDGTTYKVTGIGLKAFNGCSGLTSVTIGNSVTSIGDYAFSYCSGLTSVTIGNSVTSIGDSAFKGCTGLTSVTIGNSVTSIGDYAFYGCTGLTSVEIGNSVTSIGDYAFNGCTGLTSVGIGNSVTSIGGCAFYYCSGLTSVTIPESVTSIGNHAFHGCTGLTSVTIPESVTSIGNQAFHGCTGLTSVEIPNSVTSIGGYAFYGCGLKTVNFNAKNCSDFSSQASPFDDCPIENFIFGDKVKKIPAYILHICKTLTSVTIPESVTSIGGYAFYGCGLKTVNFNAKNCSAFSSSASPFDDCPIENFIFGDKVKKIPAYLLYQCNTLTSVTIPESVTSIGHYSFYGCSGLTSITIPNSVTSIGDNAFTGCTGLYRVEVKEIRQVSAKINVKCNIRGGKHVIGYASSSLEPDENGDVSIEGLWPRSENLCYLGFEWQNGFTVIDYIYLSTKGFSPYVGINGITPTTAKLKGSYTEIDAKVTGVEFSCGGVANIEGNTAYITGLNPDTEYTVSYTVKSDNNYTETTTCTFTTPALTMTTLAAEATSNTVAVIAAETNLSDEETSAGFEWRRYDAPDLVPSSKAPCPVVDGKLMGALNNLSANTYYKYRPYYTSASGQTYYGEWLAFGTADAYVYFEPLVRTYAATNVTSAGANVKAYVVAGSDAITSQGFEYWLSNNTMNRMRAEAAPATGVQTIEATGQWMNATLEGLKESSEYTYRAYVTTAKGTTYGEEQSFTTEKGAGINDIIADEKSEVVEVARYTIDGRMIGEPRRGVNIVRYSDGSVRKVLVK